MKNSVEKTGKTIQEAIDHALIELNVNEDSVEIEVLDEGNKGIFGILGNKVAKVRVTVKNTPGDVAASFLADVLEKMNLDAGIELDETENEIILKISGIDSGIIIGRRGETLDSLQYITGLVVSRECKEYRKVIIDIENYRLKREETLSDLAERLAQKAQRYRKSITLEPMSSYERRIIHSALQENRFVETFSIGEEPNRKVVIKPVNEAGNYQGSFSQNSRQRQYSPGSRNGGVSKR